MFRFAQHDTRTVATGLPGPQTLRLVYAYDALAVSRTISHALLKCSSVVSTLPRPILITVRPCNFVCVRYARPLALIRSTISLLIASMRSVVAGVGYPGPASTMPATCPVNRKQTTPMLGCADNSKRCSFL